MKGLIGGCLIFLGFVGLSLAKNYSNLKVNYYEYTCPHAEQIIASMMNVFIKQNPDIMPNLVRMHFHDCFVRGCDGSILLNSTSNSVAEKDSAINSPSITGYDVIEKIKAALEAQCPNTVSCADVLTFATREAVHVAGKFPWYEVRGGRKDGRVSLASETIPNLPPPSGDLKTTARFFAAKGLTLEDAVTLLGAHSFGDSHCSAIGGRYELNFNDTGKPDPTLNLVLAAKLRQICPADHSFDPTVPLDTITPDILDNKYYVGLLQNKGLFTSDATLLTSMKTKAQVQLYASHPAIWKAKFIAAIIKMGEVQVKTGRQGEIRKKCGVVN